MRARFMIISILIIVCILTPVQAYAGHNLEWGVETGVKYYYQVEHYEVTDGNLDGEIDEEIDINLRYYGMIEAPYPLDVDENLTSLQDVWGVCCAFS